jgi:hypothetical protein
MPKRLSEEEFVESFWAKVDKLDSKCWEWTGAKNKWGYGAVGKNYKILRAHRVAWELHHNAVVPNGLMVCHTCDNRLCCNPDHLWLGTAADNQQDMVKKGRHWGQKVTELLIDRILNLHKSGLSRASIGRELGIHPKTVSRWLERAESLL